MKRILVVILCFFISVTISFASPTTPHSDLPKLPQYKRQEDGIVVNASMKYKIEDFKTKYSIASKRMTDKEQCYIAIKITSLPGDNNIWRKAGFEVGHYIVMFQHRPGSMASLTCTNTDLAINRWFNGRVKYNIVFGDGWMVERMVKISEKKFTLETVIVTR